MPHWQGRFQPLHAVYRRSVLPLLEEPARARRAEARLSLRQGANLQDRRGRDPPIRSRRLELLQHEHAGGLRRGARRWAVRATGGAGSGIDPCTVELFGVARLAGENGGKSRSRCPRRDTSRRSLPRLPSELPVLVGRVISPDRARLVEGYACNVNGREFVRTPTAKVNPGDNIMILSADAGG